MRKEEIYPQMSQIYADVSRGDEQGDDSVGVNRYTNFLASFHFQGLLPFIIVLNGGTGKTLN
jgi:hypothetical protein